MKIIVFEGLGMPFSFASTYINQELVPKLVPKLPRGVTVESYTWYQTPLVPSEPFGVISHSFGWMRAEAWTPKQAKFIVSCDPRSWTCDFTGGNFSIPNGVPTYNFYRKGFMPGYVISGAVNTQLADCGHIYVPSQPAVVAKVLELLK